jgi:hypothetical protein
MSDLDSLDGAQIQDRAAAWPRAAAWRARWAGTPVVPPLRPLSADAVPILTLPAELLPLGRLAVALTAPTTHLHPLLRCAPLIYRRAPVASLAYVDLRQVRNLGPDAAQDATNTISLDPALNPDNHPTFTLLSLMTLLWGLRGDPSFPPGGVDASLADALDRCAATTPTVKNPAKQLALALHERIPVFWGDGLAEHVAADWAVRLQWYAERAAFGVAASDLLIGHLLARFPRYWPNTAAFVRLQLAPPDELMVHATALLARRRFPTTLVTAPAGGLAAILYWLEFGEWLALYSAHLTGVDPADRTPHAILFSP